MIAHMRIVVFSVVFLVGLSALHGASMAGARATHIGNANSMAPAAPKETAQAAQNRILIGAAFRSVFVGY